MLAAAVHLQQAHHRACSASAGPSTGTAAGCSRRRRSCRTDSRSRLSCSIFSACANEGGACRLVSAGGQRVGGGVGWLEAAWLACTRWHSSAM